MTIALFWLTLATGAYIGARRITASRKRETERLEKLEDDRTADLKIDGPPRFNG